MAADSGVRQLCPFQSPSAATEPLASRRADRNDLGLPFYRRAPGKSLTTILVLGPNLSGARELR